MEIEVKSLEGKVLEGVDIGDLVVLRERDGPRFVAGFVYGIDDLHTTDLGHERNSEQKDYLAPNPWGDPERWFRLEHFKDYFAVDLLEDMDNANQQQTGNMPKKIEGRRLRGVNIGDLVVLSTINDRYVTGFVKKIGINSLQLSYQNCGKNLAGPFSRGDRYYELKRFDKYLVIDIKEIFEEHDKAAEEQLPQGGNQR